MPDWTWLQRTVEDGDQWARVMEVSDLARSIVRNAQPEWSVSMWVQWLANPREHWQGRSRSTVRFCSAPPIDVVVVQRQGGYLVVTVLCPRCSERVDRCSCG